MCCKATCALNTLALILLILSFVLEISGSFSGMWYMTNGKRPFHYSEIGVAIYGGIWSECVSGIFYPLTCESKETAICAMIAFVLYAVYATGNEREFFIGFYITIVAFGFGILAGMLESINLIKTNTGKVEAIH
ncbi:hypothetical protein ACJMK2_022949 [Sinanodonta woodiana]|uniref:Uncharacterized protein n=1 Tax=Sinanodonta woodiana TaxID=1069815 RepID=A0ABD3TKJ1_SINWO